MWASAERGTEAPIREENGGSVASWALATEAISETHATPIKLSGLNGPSGLRLIIVFP